MLYITGDTHGAYYDLINRITPYDLKNTDSVIVLGDFGFLWDPNDTKDLEMIKTLPYTVTFLDGNHENYDMLETFPVEIWNGGKIHRISDNIIHLMRGQFFNIEGKNFFTMGGAYSVDKMYRIEHYSWWKDELPCNEEYNNATKNLELQNFKFDYILSHTVPLSVYYTMHTQPDHHEMELSGYFQWIYEKAAFKHWYAGHHHINKTFNDFTILYDDVIKIE